MELYVNTERFPSRLGDGLSSVGSRRNPKISLPWLSFHHVSERHTPFLLISARHDRELGKPYLF